MVEVLACTNKIHKTALQSFGIRNDINYIDFPVHKNTNKANLFNSYFHSVFTTSNVKSPNIDSLPNIPNSLSTINISEAEIFSALSNLDPKTSAGAEKIGPMVLRLCSAVLSKPLYHLYSMSIRYAIISCSWKVHKIMPIFKSGNQNFVKCYHPISLLNNVSKVLEHLIYSKIIPRITDSISNAQFGFLQNRSTLQQLLLFTKELFSSASQIDTVYFDIRKAFDSVSHTLLLSKLCLCGITGKLWCWFKSYLSN